MEYDVEVPNNYNNNIWLVSSLVENSPPTVEAPSRDMSVSQDALSEDKDNLQ
jgi:hypothetical protein